MSEKETVKSAGGIAPFGYKWCGGDLIVDETESPVRVLIYKLFIKHKRKKTVAKLLNDLGYRTRSGALFSDTTVDRLIRDTTARGVKTIGGAEREVEAIISTELWQKANNFLGEKQTKPPVSLFLGFAFCGCGGKMIVPAGGGSGEKYVCLKCRRKIGCGDLEEVFVSQLHCVEENLSDCWRHLTEKEKRIVAEQVLDRVVVGTAEINIEFAYSPNSLKTPPLSQQNGRGNKTSSEMRMEANQSALSEPLINEIEAAKFLGISRMTLLRKRNAGVIGFYRVGFRVLYSKEKHLMPFLAACEK